MTVNGERTPPWSEVDGYMVTMVFPTPLFEALNVFAKEAGIEVDTAIREAVRAYLGDGQ